MLLAEYDASRREWQLRDEAGDGWQLYAGGGLRRPYGEAREGRWRGGAFDGPVRIALPDGTALEGEWRAGALVRGTGTRPGGAVHELLTENGRYVLGGRLR